MDTAQKLWFAIAFCIGVLGLYYFRYRLPPEYQLPGREFYGEIWAVAVMLIFVLASLWSRGLTLRNDQVGDNVYYLGFLFTLSVLTMALVDFTADKQTDALVTSFGIALIATIAGIVMRVVVNNLRQDPVEVEEAARTELTNSARKLKAQLDSIVLDLNSFSRETRQSVQDTLTELVLQANNAISESVQKFSKTNQSVIERIDEAFKDFTDNSKRLNSISSKTVTAIEKLVDRVNDIEAPRGLIIDTLRPLTTAVADLTRALQEQGDAFDKTIDRLKATSDDLATAGTTVRGSVGELSAAIESIKNFAKSVAEQQTQILGSGEAIRSLTTNVQNLSGTIGTSLHALPQVVETELAVIRRHTEALEAELQRSRDVTDQVHTALLETVRALRAAI